MLTVFDYTDMHVGSQYFVMLKVHRYKCTIFVFYNIDHTDIYLCVIINVICHDPWGPNLKINSILFYSILQAYKCLMYSFRYTCRYTNIVPFLPSLIIRI